MTLKSPFNYTGGKEKIFDQLSKYFPPDIDIFYDMFGGGGGVFINIDHTKYRNIVVNDIIKPLIEFYQWIQTSEWDRVKEVMDRREIKDLKVDQAAYNSLRDRFNKTGDFIDFFLLCSSCTNNMMRFNQSLKFNQTWGKRAYNESTEERLKGYHNVLYKNDKYVFNNKNFITIVEIKYPGVKFFIYLDPPYLITDAGYNEYWSKDHERKLYDFIDNLDKHNIKFMLSNVSEHKGIINPYMNRLEKYNIINIETNYNKVSRSGKSESKEIIVTNYEVKIYSLEEFY
jgi:DNA adenine methylase Dam